MRLTGLRPENPVAMMAAYGALRLLPGARLRWTTGAPELDWGGDVVAALAAQLPLRMAAPENVLLDDPRKRGIGGDAGFIRLAAVIPHEWLSAYAAQTADGIQGTGLIAYAGNHKFVAAARGVMNALAACDVAEKVREALVGPWRYDDKNVAFGWDATARQDSAVMPQAPDAKKKPCVLGVNWLAWESLPLWQMVDGETIGVTRASKVKTKTWCYPTCAEWLTWEGLKALVLGVGTMSGRDRRALGVRLWETTIVGRSEGGEFGIARTLSDAQKPGGSRMEQVPGVLIV